MKTLKSPFVTIPLAALVFATAAQAQTRIWRCGNTYTNDEAQAKVQNCKLVEGGNVTIVQGTKVNGGAPAAAGSASARRGGESVATANPNSRIDAGEQKARDSEARGILEAELKKAEARRAELQQEWNNGEPEKLGPEHRNHQKYLDRVAELKAAIDRTEQDIAGLKRELARASGGNAVK